MQAIAQSATHTNGILAEADACVYQKWYIFSGCSDFPLCGSADPSELDWIAAPEKLLAEYELRLLTRQPGRSWNPQFIRPLPGKQGSFPETGTKPADVIACQALGAIDLDVVLSPFFELERSSPNGQARQPVELPPDARQKYTKFGTYVLRWRVFDYHEHSHPTLCFAVIDRQFFDD